MYRKCLTQCLTTSCGQHYEKKLGKTKDFQLSTNWIYSVFAIYRLLFSYCIFSSTLLIFLSFYAQVLQFPFAYKVVVQSNLVTTMLMCHQEAIVIMSYATVPKLLMLTGLSIVISSTYIVITEILINEPSCVSNFYYYSIRLCFSF